MRGDEPTPRMPNPIYPYRADEDGNTEECQICGEPADGEMGEFGLPTGQPAKGQALNDPTVTCCGRDAADCDCPVSVVAHGQCGLDHGLEIA